MRRRGACDEECEPNLKPRPKPNPSSADVAEGGVTGRPCEVAELVGGLVAETIHPACMCEGGGRGGEGRAFNYTYIYSQTGRPCEVAELVCGRRFWRPEKKSHLVTVFAPEKSRQTWRAQSSIAMQCVCQ